MNAVRAFDELAKRGCSPEATALLPPTTLYEFDKLSEEFKDKLVKIVMSGDIAKATKRSKKEKAGANKNASPTDSRDKNQDAAEELAKIIAGALPHAFREKIDGNAGFKSRAFGKLLGKAIATSFGAASKRGA